MKHVVRLSPDEVERIVCQWVLNNKAPFREGSKARTTLEVFFDRAAVRYFEVTMEQVSSDN